MTRRIFDDGKLTLVGFVAAALLVVGMIAVPVSAQDPEVPPEAEVARLLDQAKDHGAKGLLPQSWWDLDRRFDEARKQDATVQQWATLRSDARRLLNMAVFVESMRSQKSGLEALLGRYDHALDEIASLNGVVLPPELTGDERSAALQKMLRQNLLASRILTDSLSITNQHYQDLIGGKVAGQDSVITALNVEISALRTKLWDTELRAGVAEADRSAAESVLVRKQKFEDAVKQLRQSISPQEGEVLLSAEGQIKIRLHGMAFGIGSAELASGQGDLVQRLEKGLQSFAGASLRVEGHTDDSGSRSANLRLSLRRAETVARLLEHDLKLPDGAIDTAGFGPDRPVALNDSPEGRALNRRIDVVINPTDMTGANRN